jgi:deoxyribonuclease V
MSMDWPTTLDAALAIQQQLRSQVVTHDAFGPIRTVAGVDAGYEYDPAAPTGHGVAHAAIVVLAFPSLRPLDYAVARRPTVVPYVPGVRSFREAPAVLAALAQLHTRPDMLICDGHGLAHPRRFGIACHVGLLADLPAIGCAKSRLIGRHDPLPDERGAAVPLRDQGEQIGVALRSRVGTRPLYISVGHRVSLPSAIEIVIACLTRYRLPETTRAADGLASHGRIPAIAPA